MNVIVSEYNPEWQELYNIEAEKISKILGGNLLQIFHIGSTSVPYLKAKPIIDIMPVVADIAKVDLCNSDFESLGYEVMGEFGIAGRRYMRKGGNNRTHQIHTFQYDNLTDITRHLAFRDYLRKHPDIAKEYGELKSALALQHPTDIDSYGDGKGDFVKRTETSALKWYWKVYSKS